jgi:ATP-dependent helicase HrpA
MHPPISYPPQLPIIAHKDAIIDAVQHHQVVIVAGDTGSGKSTQLPKMCLEAGRGLKKVIGCTQPRRIAAISVAARVAEELGDDGREFVGYKIRFADRTGPQTRIKFMTDGILLAETQGNRKLTAYDTLIIDEAHERSLNIDFLLGYLKDLINARPDLKLIITSATIDTKKFSSHFDNAPVIEVSGRGYPVEIRYCPWEATHDAEEEPSYIDQVIQAVLDLHRYDLPGDILIFMPTERDIRETTELLTRALDERRNRSAWPGQAVILPLFGRLAPGDQKKIFKSWPGHKIVVATNVAETSITVPGIRYVIDTGLARISHYNARARTTRMPVAPISRASCDQRQGRCGRIGPGVCIRLYSEENYGNRPEYTLPEIKRSDLAEVILKMIALKLGDPATFPFIDPPAKRALADGYALLYELGAIESFHGRRLTDRGRLMARLPLDPRISRLVIAARERNALREVLIIAAALTIQDPMVRPAGQEKEADAVHAQFADPASDFLAHIAIWNLFHQTSAKVKTRSQLKKFCSRHFLSYQRMREWQDIHAQLKLLLAEEGTFHLNRRPADYDAIHQALLSGLLRNIGLKKAKNIYQGARGHEIMIFPGSYQFNKAGTWIMAAELVETTKLFARTVATIKVEWIEPIAGPLCTSTYAHPRWEKKRGQVVVDEKVSLFGLIIVTARKRDYSRTSPEARTESRQIFIQSALVEGELGGRYGFLRHNTSLVGRLEEMENRLRQRGFVADDQVLYEFYDQRLGDVCSRNELNALLKRKGSDDFLRMTEEDVVQKKPEPGTLADFPPSLRVGNFTCRLSYTFQPGTDDDGVSVDLAPEMLPHVSPSFFEWLVPGLLPDKVEFLLKGLPKGIRKQLIPIKKTAKEIAAELTPYHGSLYRALSQAVFTRYRLRIARDDWPEVPDHLLIRFRVIDGQGNMLCAARNLHTLLATESTTVPEKGPVVGIADQIRAEWERYDISVWDFEAVPEQIPLRNNGNQLYGYAYPGLQQDEQGRVDLKLFSSPETCRAATRHGLAALYCRYFPAQFKALKKECLALFSADPAAWALYEGLAGHDQIRKDILAFIVMEVFDSHSGRIPPRQTFQTKIDEVAERGLYAMGMELLDLVLAALKARRSTIDHIDKYARIHLTRSAADLKRFQDYREQLDQIVPNDFLKIYDRKGIGQIERYCQGLRIRVERAHAATKKDAAKAAELAPHIERLQKLRLENPAPGCLQLVDEYRQMLEEFKISLFAQELRTAFPVSAKRLQKKWQEIEESCY